MKESKSESVLEESGASLARCCQREGKCQSASNQRRLPEPADLQQLKTLNLEVIFFFVFFLGLIVMDNSQAGPPESDP